MRLRFNHTFLAVMAIASLGAASARADDFLGQEGDMWRASKLVGVNIYGPDKKKVGDINEVLMDKAGKVAYVVVGVGGFLGIGEKNVALPYDKVTFSQDPIAPPAAGMAQTPDIGLGTAARTDAGVATAPAATPPTAGSAAMPLDAGPLPPRPTSYPDHGTVTYTADQLKAAPTFSYAK